MSFTITLQELHDAKRKLERYEKERAELIKLVSIWKTRIKGQDKSADTVYFECIGDVRQALRSGDD